MHHGFHRVYYKGETFGSSVVLQFLRVNECIFAFLDYDIHWVLSVYVDHNYFGANVIEKKKATLCQDAF